MAYDKIVDSAKLDAGMTATANAIRAKTGGTGAIPWDSATGFKTAVEAIQTGGGEVAEPVVQPLSVTKNGTYSPPEGVDGYAPVVVNVPSLSENVNVNVLFEAGPEVGGYVFYRDGAGAEAYFLIASGGVSRQFTSTSAAIVVNALRVKSFEHSEGVELLLNSEGAYVFMFTVESGDVTISFR